MKAEINNENKAKFFAMYWNQDVLSSSMYGDGGTIYSLTMGENSHDNKWLELKPLSQISDEDAIEVAKIDSSVNWDNGLPPSVWRNVFGIPVVSNGTGLIQKYGQILLSLPFLSYHQVDVIRSKGYALPWLGLSVEEMVKAGWIKLT